ncbi:RidA family protein [Heliobacillus mobilis]|uniref:RidA family protein n=2 Tax=Heliobacterium TaxID=2697 RepID=A0A6I3SGV2_HELMO|nr:MULTISPECIES: RidA family protein [Heliobacterium]MBC9783917.1 RidA family protein [Heliobacterium chlorum]MTV48058.1 RidA family protein [Heliobacterium mobile]
MSIEAKLQEMGLTIPDAPKPVAAYVPAIKVGDYVYTSGQIPFVNGELKHKGKVGKDVTPEQAYEAAKICCLNCLSVIKGQIGNLDQIKQIVKVVGFVNSAPGFQGQPGVVNGASELLGRVFGDKGQHARSAVGVNELPLDAAVEVEMIVQVGS